MNMGNPGAANDSSENSPSPPPANPGDPTSGSATPQAPASIGENPVTIARVTTGNDEGQGSSSNPPLQPTQNVQGEGFSHSIVAHISSLDNSKVDRAPFAYGDDIACLFLGGEGGLLFPDANQRPKISFKGSLDDQWFWFLLPSDDCGRRLINYPYLIDSLHPETCDTFIEIKAVYKDESGEERESNVVKVNCPAARFTDVTITWPDPLTAPQVLMNNVLLRTLPPPPFHSAQRLLPQGSN